MMCGTGWLISLFLFMKVGFLWSDLIFSAKISKLDDVKLRCGYASSMYENGLLILSVFLSLIANVCKIVSDCVSFCSYIITLSSALHCFT